MTYSLTLVTDEYTLRGEVYEHEEGEGWDYQLTYTPTDSEEEFVWDSVNGSLVYSSQSEAVSEILARLIVPKRTIDLCFS